MEAGDHCAGIVREADHDRFLATLFAPAERRGALFALYAFNAEILHVRAAISGPLPGEIRLQWWSDVLNGERNGEAAAHPTASALLAAITKYRLPTELLADLVTAHIFDLYDEPMQTGDELESYATRTSASIINLAALILNDGRDPGIGALAFHAGVAAGLTQVLQALPIHLARGQCYLPLDLLARHGATQTDLASGKAELPLRSALAELRLRIRGRLDLARGLVGNAPAAVLPALLPVALIRPLLARMERSGYDPFVPMELPPWRRQWLIWRAAKNPARIAG